MVGLLLSIVLFGGLLSLLFGIVRFAIISPAKTRGSGQRLRRPQAEGIGQISGFPPSPELVTFYREGDIVERSEFYLVDRSKEPPVAWFIGGFSPLTPLDVRERLKVAGLREAIPLADDLGKGTYYVTRDGAVRLHSPNAGPTQVAPSISAFARFEIHNQWPDEPVP